MNRLDPRRVLAAIAASATVVLVAIGAASSAQAADYLGLSSDGTTWSSSITVPLFSADDKVVPGDDETRSFSVRNQAGDDGTLTITASDDDTDELISHGDLDVQVRVAGGSWVSLASDAADQRIDQQLLAAGGQAQVDVQATFDPQSTNWSQERSLPLSLTVVLEDAGTGGGNNGGGGGSTSTDGGGSGSGSTDGSSGSGILPSTGGVALWVVVTGAACVTAGGLVVVRRTREDEK